MSKLSLYADSLSPDAKARSLDRIESIGGPYLFSSDFVGGKSDVVPPAGACDLISVVFSTADQFYN